jgi:hypothetical protein
MAAKRDSLDPIDEVARLLALNLKRERGLQEVIAELDSVGIKQSRIAELLGTSPGYVNVALTRAKEGDDKKKGTTKRSKTS